MRPWSSQLSGIPGRTSPLVQPQAPSSSPDLTLEGSTHGLWTPKVVRAASSLSPLAVTYLMETPIPNAAPFPTCHPQATPSLCPVQPLLRVLSSMSPAGPILPAPRF